MGVWRARDAMPPCFAKDNWVAPCLGRKHEQMVFMCPDSQRILVK